MVKYLKPNPDWAEHEKPSLPGSASMPGHTPWVRLAYALVALLVGITGGLGNALVNANLPTIQGQLGLTPSESAWLPAAYIMLNVTASALVYKFRQQYGMRLFTEIGLGLYVLATLLHLLVEGFAMAVFVRAISGFAAAATSTLALLYMLQAFPRPAVGRALVLGLSIAPLASPLAWILSPALLNVGEWHNLYVFEAGLALCAFAAVVVLKLPPGVHIQAFEPLDFLSFVLLSSGLALVVAVLAQGPTQWWFDTPWLAYALIGAVVLLALAFAIEYHRDNPLIHVRWFAHGATWRFLFGALLLRFLTMEQNYGVMGLLRTLGMGPDQLQSLFVVVLLGTVVGVVASAATFQKNTILAQILVSIGLLALGGFLDWGGTSLVRPHDFYVSQFLVSMGAGMFMGPLMLVGIMQALKFGPAYMITFSVMFSVMQNFAGFAGSALLNTYQTHREHQHSVAIVSHLDPSNPQVAQRLRLQQQVYASTITDPVRQGAQGAALLSQTARREANVRAFQDVFALMASLAGLFMLWSLASVIRIVVQSRRAAAAPPATPAQLSRP